jgi:hypothetical protein
VDTVEKIDIENPTSGIYTLTVSHKGTLNDGAQDFSLVVTGSNFTLGTADLEISSVYVWPNPALTEINFKFPASEKATQLMLYDIRGRVVYEDIISKGNGTIRGQIDTSAFARGVYILKINQGNTSTQKKVVLK